MGYEAFFGVGRWANSFLRYENAALQLVSINGHGDA